MGGSIAIAARFNNGEAICVDGYTNFMPSMIVNNTTLSGDDSIVRKTLMEVSAHPNYFGPQPFRVIGYGMVVVDFIAHRIHSMQGYTNFTHRYTNQLFDINKSGWRDGTFVHVISEQAETLLDNNRIYVVSVNGEDVERTLLTRDHLMAETEDYHARTMEYWRTGENPPASLFTEIEIVTDPFEVIEYQEGTSLASMKQALCLGGFPLTKRDGLNALFSK